MQKLSTNKHAAALTPAKIEEAIGLYLDGIGGETIALHFGVTRQAVYYHLKKRGLDRRESTFLGKENPFWRGGEMHQSKVRNIVAAAIKAGVLKRPDNCSACGKPYRFKNGQNGIHAHHDDYNKPLEVRWLCLPCHHQWHCQNRAIPLKTT